MAGCGPGRLPTQGSHRPVRAHISAYGSSNHGFTPVLLSVEVTLTRNQGSMPLPCGPATGPCFDVSLSSTGSGRVPYPCFLGTIKTLRLPASHPPTVRCLRVRVPRRCVLSFASTGPRREARDQEVSGAAPPAAAWCPVEPTGSPKFLGNPQCLFAHAPATPADLLTPNQSRAAARSQGNNKGVCVGTFEAPPHGFQARYLRFVP